MFFQVTMDVAVNTTWGSFLGAASYYDDNITDGFSPDDDENGPLHTGKSAIYYLDAVIIPAIGVFGILGNSMNLAVLSWCYGKSAIETLERRALVGLIVLSVSDLCLCILFLPHAAFSESKTFFSDHSLEMYYRLYGNYIHNVFIKISTWLTVIIAGARYVGICHPLKARIMLGSMATKLAIALTFLFWMALLSPLLLSYKLLEVPIDNSTVVYILDIGIFNTNHYLQMTMTYIWAILGFFMPIVFLFFCNVCLIRALRASHRLRQSAVRNRATACDHSSRITVTLVALVIMFLVLVAPSELIHFYTDLVPESYATMELLFTLGNLLQAVNFSFHFILYCTVNVTFRRATIMLFFIGMARIRCYKVIINSDTRRRSSISVKTTFSTLSQARKSSTAVDTKV